jgi:hypothetical protein
MSIKSVINTLTVGELVERATSELALIQSMTLEEFAESIRGYVLSNTQRMFLQSIDNNKPFNLTEKKCGVCEQMYPATEEFFYKCGTSSHGLQYKCKQCQKEYGLKYYYGRKKK